MLRITPVHRITINQTKIFLIIFVNCSPTHPTNNPMNKFIRNNFLAICITLAVMYAFTKKAIIFQQEAKIKSVEVVMTNQKTNKKFMDYWQNNKPEVVKYELKEDSVYVGEGSLTFRLDYVKGVNKDDSVQVLKSDFIGKIKKENYDYSAMTSTYLPLNLSIRPHAMKIINSVQEPEETAFLVLSQIPKSYEINSKNTFKVKTKEHFILERKNLEDELWTKIRMNPDNLLVGDIEIIPSFAFWQSVRKSPEVCEAKAELNNYTGTEFKGTKLKNYTLNYPDLKRSLSIIFEQGFPHEIVGWKRVSDEKVATGKKVGNL